MKSKNESWKHLEIYSKKFFLCLIPLKFHINHCIRYMKESIFLFQFELKRINKTLFQSHLHTEDKLWYFVKQNKKHTIT